MYDSYIKVNVRKNDHPIHKKFGHPLMINGSELLQSDEKG